MEFALTGEFLDAPRAHTLGLVNRLVLPGQALVGAMALARQIAANAPLAVRASKQVIVESAAWPAEQVWTRQQSIVDPIGRSEDAREGARAFAEKRPPNWQGR
jgi:enoyl-CoA hydratase/carnithine racemase